MKQGRQVRDLKLEANEDEFPDRAFADAATQVEKLALQLRELAAVQPLCPVTPMAPVAKASQIYQARRKADKVANIAGISASPAFDTLLDLFINASAGRLVSVSSACIGTACPATTALRWIRYLEERGLVTRKSDPYDQRRVFVSLTNDGTAIIEKAISLY